MCNLWFNFLYIYCTNYLFYTLFYKLHLHLHYTTYTWITLKLHLNYTYFYKIYYILLYYKNVQF
jgi:hypothetical protein